MSAVLVLRCSYFEDKKNGLVGKKTVFRPQGVEMIWERIKSCFQMVIHQETNASEVKPQPQSQMDVMQFASNRIFCVQTISNWVVDHRVSVHAGEKLIGAEV